MEQSRSAANALGVNATISTEPSAENNLSFSHFCPPPTSRSSALTAHHRRAPSPELEDHKATLDSLSDEHDRPRARLGTTAPGTPEAHTRSTEPPPGGVTSRVQSERPGECRCESDHGAGVDAAESARSAKPWPASELPQIPPPFSLAMHKSNLQLLVLWFKLKGQGSGSVRAYARIM